MEIIGEEKEVNPKVKAVTYTNILVTTKGPKKSSIIIEDNTKAKTLNEVQTVVAAGPQVFEGIKVGSKVLLDVDKMFAKRANGGSVRLINLMFSKSTGELITSDNYKNFKEEDREHYLLLSDREVLAVLD